jgi:hypothetical protein
MEQTELKPIPSEIIDKIIQEHSEQVEDAMGHLHNRFVVFIAEARIPLAQVSLVLQMLLSEITEQAMKKYEVK